MASYVIAGAADDMGFAEAELLADRLQASLPFVAVAKHCIPPHQWADFVRQTAQRMGFQYASCPMVWTEEGRLVGGVQAFKSEVQHKYGIQWTPDDGLLRRVAEENLHLAAEAEEDALQSKHQEILREYLESREHKMLDAEKVLSLLAEENDVLKELAQILRKQLIQMRALVKLSEPPKPIKGLLRKGDGDGPEQKTKSVNFSDEPEESPAPQEDPQQPAPRPKTPAQLLQHTRLMVKHAAGCVRIEGLAEMEESIGNVARSLQDSGSEYVTRDLLRVYDRYPELFDLLLELENGRMTLQETCMSMDAATLSRQCGALHAGFQSAASDMDALQLDIERRADQVYSGLLKVAQFADETVDPNLRLEASRLAR